MDIDAFFQAEFDEHLAVARATRADLSAAFGKLVLVSAEALKDGKKLVFFGNGGSAADAQHLAAELVVRYKADRRPLAAIALTTDSSTLTAAANDLGYDTVFSRQVAALCATGDVAIGITTSGNSINVIRGLETARDIGAVAAALTGCGGGQLLGLADPLLIVPSDTVARIQEMHITLGQMLCDALEQTCT